MSHVLVSFLPLSFFSSSFASSELGPYSSQGENGWRAFGLKVTGFQHAIDVRTYPPNTFFVGEADGDAPRCPEMQSGKPWTYQVRDPTTRVSSLYFFFVRCYFSLCAF